MLARQGRKDRKRNSEGLTNVSRLLGILVVRQVVTWYEDGHSATILERQADLVEVVPLLMPKDRQVNSIVRCNSAHKGKLEQCEPCYEWK